MATNNNINVNIRGNASGLTTAVNQANNAIKGMTTNTKTLTQVGMATSVALGQAFVNLAQRGLTELKQAFTGVISAAYESQKVNKQTEAILRSTGHAANLAALDIQNLAKTLSMKTGIDDEAIQSSMNMLLTFKQVKDVAGANNDIFSQAAALTLDLGNVFGSADSAAKQLGKALADPERGITALRRSGINFTNAQKEQIKTLIQNNNLLDAQKLILKEVRSQVGGTAEATATAGDKFKVAWENAKESIGEALLPALEGFLTFVQDSILPLVERLTTAFKEGGLSGAIKQAADEFVNFTTNGGKLGTIVAGITAILAGATAAWVAYNVATVIATISTLGFSAAIASIPVIGQIAVIVGLIIGALTMLVLKSEAARDMLKTIWNGFINALEWGLNDFLNASEKLINAGIWVINKLITAYNAIPFLDNIGYIQDVNFELSLNALKFDMAADSANGYSDALSYASYKAQLLNNELSALGEILGVTDGGDSGGGGGGAPKAPERTEEETPFLKVIYDLIQARLEKAKEQWGKIIDVAKDAYRKAADAAKQARQQLQDRVKEVASTVTEGFDIVSLTESSFAKYLGGDALVAVFQKRLQQAREFLAMMRQLVAKGLDPFILNQLANAGPEAGYDAAKLLLSDPKTFDDINNLSEQIVKVGNRTGRLIGNENYGEAVATTQQRREDAKKTLDDLREKRRIDLERTGRGYESVTVHVHVKTNADPNEIAREIAWAMRSNQTTPRAGGN